LRVDPVTGIDVREDFVAVKILVVDFSGSCGSCPGVFVGVDFCGVALSVFAITSIVVVGGVIVFAVVVVIAVVILREIAEFVSVAVAVFVYERCQRTCSCSVVGVVILRCLLLRMRVRLGSQNG